MTIGGLAFHHIGVAVAEIEKSQSLFETLFGYYMVRGPFEDPIQRVRVCFLAMKSGGDQLVELVAPLDGDSPISNFLRKGMGGYHVCYETDSLDDAIKEGRDAGCVALGPPVPAVAFDNRRIAWLYTPGRFLVELLERA